jgi:membrane-bound lytic murein transglycosylase
MEEVKMKKLLLLTALVPFFSCAQPLNTMNNPNMPDYQIPSQQRMQQQMQMQQTQQKGMLNQQLQTQTRIQQQHLEAQINNNTQQQPRIRQTLPNELEPGSQQMLPNTNGGMLNGSERAAQQEHMLQPKTNGSMLNPTSPTTPQPNIPLKTIGP